MVATYRPGEFIEKTRSLSRDIYSNVSFVGSTALAEKLKLLGTALHQRLIVTQVVPPCRAIIAVLEYKNASQVFSRRSARYVSLEATRSQRADPGIKRTAPSHTEKLIDTLENTAISIWASDPA